MTDENRTFLLFPDDGDDLTEWDEASDLTIQNEQLEEILSEERALELERELEQDENPRDYTVELEDEEEEAAPVSEKRLKRQIRAEALARLEDAARTEDDFRYVVSEWDRLDRNRERRERDHENLRGDVPVRIHGSSQSEDDSAVFESATIPPACQRQFSGYHFFLPL